MSRTSKTALPHSTSSDAKTLAAVVLLALMALVTAAVAGGTKWIVHDDLDDFAGGELAGTALVEPGVLVAGVTTTTLAKTAEDRLLDALALPGGPLLLATGDRGALEVLWPGEEQPQLYHRFPLEVVQRLAADGDGGVYAATLPGGRIYHVARPRRGEKARVEVILETETAYVWDLLVRPSGELLVATGNPGRILAVSPRGGSKTILETDDNHVLSLAAGPRGTIFAGTADRGRVYRLEGEGEAYVLWDGPYSDVTALVSDHAGGVYALATGTRDGRRRARGGGGGRGERAGAIPSTSFHMGIVVEAPAGGDGGEIKEADSGDDAPDAPRRTKTPPTASRDRSAGSGAGGSLLVHLDRDGAPRVLWEPEKTSLISLLRVKDRLLMGSAQTGRLYAVDPASEKRSILAEVGLGSVVALRPASTSGSVLVVVDGPPRVLRLDPDPGDEAHYRSPVVDAGLFARWGRVVLRPAPGTSPPAALRLRSGNTDEPGSGWSPWHGVGPRGHAQVPPARFLQYEVSVRGDPSRVSLDRVEIAYDQVNVPPHIESFEVLPRDVQLVGSPPRQEPNGAVAGAKPAPSTRARPVHIDGMRSARWTAKDENGDALRATLELRRTTDEHWTVLADNLTRPFYAWQAAGLAEGEYVLRLTVDDGRDNPASRRRRTQALSKPFVIDLRPPRIEDLRLDEERRLRCTVVDETSRLRRATYAIERRDPQPMTPVDGLIDDLRETFDVTLEDLPTGDVLVTVAVEDQEGNRSASSLRVTLP